MERNCIFSILRVLSKNELVEKALPFVTMMFSLFGNDTLGSFAGFPQEVLGEQGFDGEDNKAKLTFVRSKLVLDGLFSR